MSIIFITLWEPIQFLICIEPRPPGHIVHFYGLRPRYNIYTEMVASKKNDTKKSLIPWNYERNVFIFIFFPVIYLTRLDLTTYQPSKTKTDK